MCNITHHSSPKDTTVFPYDVDSGNIVVNIIVFIKAVELMMEHH